MNPDLLLTPAQFCEKFNACHDGKDFAIKYDTMREVWEACASPSWLLWICSVAKIPLEAKMCRLFACWCARNTPIADGRKTWELLTDERSKNAVLVAERFANGEVTGQELAAARAAARAAAWVAAWDAARDAAWDAALAAALASARAAALAAALAAARDVAADAALAAARAAWDAAGAAQAKELRRNLPNPFPVTAHD